LYAIKECSSCGTLYTRDCDCSKGNVEDKILIPKPPKNCARFTRAGEAYKRCTCAKCGSGLGKGLCYICGHNQNSLNDSPSISETSSQSPPNINHCCYECGDPLDGIFYKRCTCKSCGKDAHIGYNCPSKVPVLFDAEYESNSSDDQSCSEEDVLEKIVSKPLSEEEIIPMKSLHTHNSSLLVPSKIDSLLDEFTGELTLLKSIPPGIDEADCDFEEDILLIEKLLYNNSSPRPPEEFVSANSDAKIESFSPSRILVKDSDSLMEEIDLFYTLDYPMPLGIEDDDYDSERGLA
nr:hypothetical protein [Tanacetum cinerariifolium]